ncbi:MAG: hypothetical protein ACOYBW_05505 [Fluviibacter phosphoraccumulans]
MSQIVKFTYSLESAIFEFPDLAMQISPEAHAQWVECVGLMNVYSEALSDDIKKKNLIKLLKSLPSKWAISIDPIPGNLFEEDSLYIDLTPENTDFRFDVYPEESEYAISFDIEFELHSKKSINEKKYEAWGMETGGFPLPAFDNALGEYVMDSGSQVCWEIED